MKNLHLGVTPATAASPPRLRADGIQTATLIQLGRALAAGDTGARDLLDALEDLGRVADGIPRDGELDDALSDVATYAQLDAADMDLTTSDVAQLRDALNAADVARGNVRHLPAPHDRRWTA